MQKGKKRGICNGKPRKKKSSISKGDRVSLTFWEEKGEEYCIRKQREARLRKNYEEKGGRVMSTRGGSVFKFKDIW